MTVAPVHVDDAVLDTSARQIVPLSGGKDSSSLAVYLKLNYPDVDFEYVTTDTGVELPEAYDYFERLEHILGKEIVRITALDMLKVPEKHGRTPFDVILYEHFSGFLPSPQSRWCTRMLKIHPFENYIGNDKAYSYIAIRADEKRQGYLNSGKPVMISEEPNITPVYPFKDNGVTIEDVQQILTTAASGCRTTTRGGRAPVAISAFSSSRASGRGSRSTIPTSSRRRKNTRLEKMDANSPGTKARRSTRSRTCLGER